MRRQITAVSLASLLTAACSSGPSEEAVHTAQIGMQRCAGDVMHSVRGVKASFTPADPKDPASIGKPVAFEASGNLPEYKEMIEKDGKPIEHIVSASLKFASANPGKASLTAWKNGTANGGRNFQTYPETVTGISHNVDVTFTFQGLKKCAEEQNAALFPANE